MQTNSRELGWQSLDAAEDDSGLDISGFIRRRKSFVIVLALVGVGVGYLWFQQQTPLYKSSALLEVIHHNADKYVEGLLGERSLEDAVFVVASPKVLGPAYENNDLGKLDTLRGLSKDAALARMAEMLDVEILSPNILELACEGPYPGDTAVIADAVAEVYIQHQKNSYTDATAELQELLHQVKEDLHEELKAAEDEYGKFRMQSQLLSDGSNFHQDQLQSIGQQISQVVIKRSEVKSELKALEEALRSGGTREALLLMVDKSTEDSRHPQTDVEDAVLGARDMAQALFPLLMEEAMLAQEVGTDHPTLVSLRKRIEVTRRHFENMAGMKPDRQGDNAARPDFLSVYIQSLQQEARMLEQKEMELQALFMDTEKQARTLMNDEIENQRRIHEKERLSTLFANVVTQIGETKLNTNIGGISAQTLQNARHGSLVYPSLAQFLGIGGFIGAFLGLGLGYVVEMADRSFRKPEEIVREFGVPIVGHVPYMNEKRLKAIPDSVSMDRTVVTAHLPRSRPAEAYRSIRTAICFSAVGSQHRVLQVTSPTAGDGKSTLAVNLAVSLAQSGKKTVLVESDFRRPKVHKVTGISNDAGIVDVLRGEAELSDVIQSTEVEDFFVLPCGQRPRNPSELLSRPEYEALLQVLRQKYDYVVIDTPPVLVVTDPCSVAPRADAVIVCMRLSRHTRDFGRRTLEQLRDVGANIAGISINGVDESDAYGYGSYNYTDYRNQYRDYHYGYGSGDDREGYFSEEDAPGKPAEPLLATSSRSDRTR